MADFPLSAAPYLGAAGAALVNLDENKTGADDFAGLLLMHVAYVIAAVAAGEDLPDFPEIIKAGTTNKISGIARISLMVAASILAIAQFQFAGNAATVLKYSYQAIQNLLDGVPVPAPPKI
jgi:hypothetical protein